MKLRRIINEALLMKNIANFLFEAGMLKRTPRTGFQFLGSGAESVAEHIFRTTYIGFALGKMAKGVDADRIIKMCLFHDLPEARTGDQNYVNKKYVEVNERKAIDDMARPLSFGGDIKDVILEFNEGKTEEARLARGAGQLGLLLPLQENKDPGDTHYQ